jgi:hypothetical protein
MTRIVVRRFAPPELGRILLRPMSYKHFVSLGLTACELTANGIQLMRL